MSLIFSRVRILAGGVVLADQVEFNRLGRTLHKLMSPQAYIDLCNESFDCSVSTSLPAAGEWIHNPVLAGGEKRIQMPLTQLGLFAQSKILPCRYLNSLSLEFEITPDANEWLNIVRGAPTWELFDVSLKANMLQLDSGLESAIATKMLSGVELPMATREYVTVTQVLTGGTFNLQLTRGLSRLTGIFVTFERPVVGDGFAPSEAAAVIANNTNPPKMNLYYPTNAEDLPEWQLQIGSKKWPSYPVRSRTESWYRLRQAMCTQGSHIHNYGMSFDEFCSTSFIVALDTEKECSSAYSGYNMRNGAQVFFSGKNFNLADGTEFPTKAYLTLCFESMVTLSDAGVTLLE